MIDTGALKIFGVAFFVACSASAPFAAENPRCAAIDVPRNIVASRGGSWMDLSPDQWQFLRGVYALDPNTPAGLPVGDRAALATMQGNEQALVFFIDGDKACSAMPVPVALTVLLKDVGAGAIKHAGAGL